MMSTTRHLQTQQVKNATRPGACTRAIVVGLVVLVLTSITGGVAISAGGDVPVLLGCTGTMVISNVDCSMGVATAYDKPDNDPSNGLAPWCNGRIDTTVYGCMPESRTPEHHRMVDSGRSKRVQCDEAMPTLHPDGVLRSAEANCGDRIWIGALQVRLAENTQLTRRCLAIANPTPACTP